MSFRLSDFRHYFCFSYVDGLVKVRIGHYLVGLENSVSLTIHWELDVFQLNTSICSVLCLQCVRQILVVPNLRRLVIHSLLVNESFAGIPIASIILYNLFRSSSKFLIIDRSVRNPPLYSQSFTCTLHCSLSFFVDRGPDCKRCFCLIAHYI